MEAMSRTTELEKEASFLSPHPASLFSLGTFAFSELG